MKKNNLELSKTEFRIATYLCLEYTAKQIAFILCKSIHTVTTHLKNIKIKNNLQSSVGISVNYTLQYGDAVNYLEVDFNYG